MCGFFSPPPPPPPVAAALLTQVIEAAPPLFSFQFGMAMLVLALSLTLMPLIRERLRGGGHAAATARPAAEGDEGEGNRDGESDDEGDDEHLGWVLAERLRNARFDPREMVASVISQLGESAFLVVSSFLAVAAVGLQTASRWGRQTMTGRTVAWSANEKVKVLVASAKAQPNIEIESEIIERDRARLLRAVA